MHRIQALVLVTVLSLSFSACICGSFCPDDYCGAHGECIEGDCVCDDGYGGVQCDSYLNAKFDGRYAVAQDCADSMQVLSDSASFAPRFNSKKEFSITGLWRSASSIVQAQVRYDGYSFDIPRQPISAQHDIASSEGSITYDARSAHLSYRIYDRGAPTIVDSCTVTFTR
jgi:hypothetical protein